MSFNVSHHNGLALELDFLRQRVLTILGNPLYSKISGNNSFDITLPDCLIAIDQFSAELEAEKEQLLLKAQREYQDLSKAIEDPLQNQ